MSNDAVVVDFIHKVVEVEFDKDITMAATQLMEAATAAASSAVRAETWAEGTDEQIGVLGGEHSAKGWAEVSGSSANAAHDSEVAAAGSASAAAGSASAAAQSAAESAGISYLVRKNSTTYTEGAVAFAAAIPSPLVLECTTAGTTGATEPSFSGATEGNTVNDGSVVWTYKVLVGESSSSSRVIGEIVTSSIPLADASLHLLDGELLFGNGIYSDFVNHIGELYQDDPTNECFMQPYYKLTYNGTIVGTTVTYNDKIISGFSANNYFRAMADFSPQSYSWEIVLKFTTGASVSGDQGLCGSDTTNYDPIGFRITSGKFKIDTYTSGSSQGIVGTGTHSVQPSTTYIVRIKFTGSLYTLEYSTDNGATFTTDVTKSSTTVIGSACSLIVGGEGANSAGNVGTPFQGTIDLSGCYIKINNETVWEGLNETNLTAEEAWQRDVTNFGICNKFVYDSTNNTVRLPKSSSQDRRLIKTYSNGSQWYRIYSDGWCEQGGMVAKGGTTAVVNLHIPMRDKNYNVFLSEALSTADTGGVGLSVITANTIKTFNESGFLVSVDSTYDFYWMTMGYIDMIDEPTNPIYEYVCVGTSTKPPTQVVIDNVVTDLNTKSNKALSNLTQDGEDHFLNRDFTIIYPNGGTEANPANVTKDTRYINSNPFAGYEVIAMPQLKINDEWVDFGMNCTYGGSSATFGGIQSRQIGTNIVTQTARSYLVVPSSSWSCDPLGRSSATAIDTAQCRIKVWKVGKVASA